MPPITLGCLLFKMFLLSWFYRASKNVKGKLEIRHTIYPPRKTKGAPWIWDHSMWLGCLKKVTHWASPFLKRKSTYAYITCEKKIV